MDWSGSFYLTTAPKDNNYSSMNSAIINCVISTYAFPPSSAFCEKAYYNTLSYKVHNFENRSRYSPDSLFGISIHSKGLSLLRSTPL